MQGESRQEAPHWPGWLAATAICIRFYSRLPVPRLPGEGDLHALPDFRLVPRALPLAALVIALPAALVQLAGGLAGVNAYLAATLAITALVLTTGAFHEDGLADTADGLFGGTTPERRLEIMKDSRVGSYGAMALGLSLLLRVTALAAILQAAGGWAAAAAILAAAPWSRSEGVRLLAGEAAARSSGASAAVGRPAMVTAGIASALALALGLAATLAAGLPPLGLALGLVLAGLAVTWLAQLARRLIGGQTGDIIGAAQQISEIAIYCGFAFVLGAR
ncbi:adenosylcobinamide-GDP ribazoletransferase [Bosea caraganae]|uniref:Adenosylcobinamide-GDP ribazoletransferase n=2 Tax=Bosea caraganae TaxID=2763117 RepID=A0A370L3W9_9HYPH|nr:adenosylcobinamide-GDP ribazoletransferase [Bosea caraganae]RDJ23103.1 adenosylcobinamide-GDP ribazoletransferase [Bosea caraganae]RDJ28882.1 adenosylcobinamide-GDP ribazoletransferase [Bosea caraganae]